MESVCEAAKGEKGEEIVVAQKKKRDQMETDRFKMHSAELISGRRGSVGVSRRRVRGNSDQADRVYLLRVMQQNSRASWELWPRAAVFHL